MADLSITSGSGAQTTTQNPQGLVSAGTSTEASSAVQPGGTNLQPETTATPTGISLQPAPLAFVNVNASSQPAVSSNATAAPTVQSKHHINAGLLGISIGLLVIAAVAFLVITRAAKNTTNNY